jgi:hypothetical protein
MVNYLISLYFCAIKCLSFLSFHLLALTDVQHFGGKITTILAFLLCRMLKIGVFPTFCICLESYVSKTLYICCNLYLYTICFHIA